MHRFARGLACVLLLAATALHAGCGGGASGLTTGATAGGCACRRHQQRGSDGTADLGGLDVRAREAVRLLLRCGQAEGILSRLRGAAGRGRRSAGQDRKAATTRPSRPFGRASTPIPTTARTRKGPTSRSTYSAIWPATSGPTCPRPRPTLHAASSAALFCLVVGQAVRQQGVLEEAGRQPEGRQVIGHRCPVTVTIRGKLSSPSATPALS